MNVEETGKGIKKRWRESAPTRKNTKKVIGGRASTLEVKEQNSNRTKRKNIMSSRGSAPTIGCWREGAPTQPKKK